MRKLFILLLAFGTVPLMKAQLYLITGSTTPKYNTRYATRLLAVGVDGKLEQRAELNTGTEGSEWIGISQEDRKAVVLVQGSNRTVVVDLDTAAVVKQCKWPKGAGTSLIDQWLVNLPSGLGFVKEMAPPDITKTYLTRMQLDSSMACDESFSAATAGDMRYVHISGGAGLADTGSHQFLEVGIDRDGKIRAAFPSGSVYFPFEVAAGLAEDISEATTVTAIVLNTTQALVINVAPRRSPRGNRQVLLRKSDSTWRVLPAFNDWAADIRAFGKYIALAEAHFKDERLRQSAGRSGGRAKDAATGPAIRDRFEQDEMAYPGVLHVYDIDFNRTYTIKTDQGDSEIILIEDGTVYYRIDDRLYAAPISDEGVGAAQLLATADAIRDAHWAFLKRR